MKKILLFSTALLILSSCLIAQKQINDANAEVREVPAFHGVKSSHGITVYLNQSNAIAVAVSANDTEHRNKIKTVVEDGILKIYFETENWKVWKNFSNKNLRVYVSAKDLDLIHASSGSDIVIEGSIKSGDLTMDASSGASIKGKIEASSLEVDQSSGSTIIISGTIDGKLKIEGSSGSTFRGYNLTVENCDAESSSGAGIEVTVNKELSVEASSGGYIYFKGNGLIRDVHTSSGGSVTRKS
ncbi:MAG: head GIN domain-containing protein [Chitinophagaceae bacterium]